MHSCWEAPDPDRHSAPTSALNPCQSVALYFLWKGDKLFPFAVRWSSYSGPNHAAALWISLGACNCAAGTCTSGAVKSRWRHPLWQPVRWDKDKCCASTSLFLSFSSNIEAEATAGMGVVLAGSPKAALFSGHTWLLCFSVHVLRFLDRCIHGNRTMNGPFKASSTTASNTRQSASARLFYTTCVCVKQPLMSQRVNDMSSCQHSTLHSTSSTETVLWHPVFNTLKSKCLCIHIHVQIHILINILYEFTNIQSVSLETLNNGR